MFAVRNIAKYSPPVFERGPDQRHDWEICVELATRLIGPRPVGRLLRWPLLRSGPEGIARRSPCGSDPTGSAAAACRCAQLRADPARRRPRPARAAAAAPSPAPRSQPCAARARSPSSTTSPAALAAGARWSTARCGWCSSAAATCASNNSWMHNSAALVEGKGSRLHAARPPRRRRGTRARRRRARHASRRRPATIEVPVEVTDEMMPGVVSLPHGWGHHRDGARLGVAAAPRPGASVNDVTDETLRRHPHRHRRPLRRARDGHGTPHRQRNPRAPTAAGVAPTAGSCPVSFLRARSRTHARLGRHTLKRRADRYHDLSLANDLRRRSGHAFCADRVLPRRDPRLSVRGRGGRRINCSNRCRVACRCSDMRPLVLVVRFLR